MVCRIDRLRAVITDSLVSVCSPYPQALFRFNAFFNEIASAAIYCLPPVGTAQLNDHWDDFDTGVYVQHQTAYRIISTQIELD